MYVNAQTQTPDLAELRRDLQAAILYGRPLDPHAILDALDTLSAVLEATRADLDKANQEASDLADRLSEDCAECASRYKRIEDLLAALTDEEDRSEEYRRRVLELEARVGPDLVPGADAE